MFTLIRLGIFLLTRRWGLIVLGVLLLMIGLIMGLSSHHGTYQTISHGTFTPYVVDDGNDYIQQNNGSTYYIIHQSDLSPAFNGSQVFKSNSDTFVFVAENDSQNVDVKLTDGTQLSGTGYQVEKITLYDSNGQAVQQYTTNEYTQNPNGYDINNWPIAIVLILVGLILGGLSFFVGRKNRVQKSAGFNVAPSAAMGMQGQGQANPNPYAAPYQQPNPYQQQNPYQQPYQGPAQYAGPYNPAQPANPYNAPPAPQYPYPSYSPQPGSYDKTQLANPSQPGSYDKTQRANPYDQPPQQ